MHYENLLSKKEMQYIQGKIIAIDKGSKKSKLKTIKIVKKLKQFLRTNKCITKVKLLLIKKLVGNYFKFQNNKS